MILALLSLAALIGAPVLAGWLGWRVYCGTPWCPPSDTAARFERIGIAATVAAAIFSGWLDVCHKILEAIKP